MTSREVSERLRKAGFKHNSDHAYLPKTLEKNPEWHDTRCDKGLMGSAELRHCLPAYTADVLFQWLRDNYWEPDVKFFEVQEDGIYLASFNDSESYWIEFKTTLTDLLGEAICEILERSKG